ncbi:glutathione S-transferase family protein [Hoeflea sp. TYP-13]|uniref:glutathione S-transferase family protein n=1 Tax=Hoeflea sp. TYP-13 TaxID=3230023 RepID=UPI0034C64F8A
MKLYDYVLSGNCYKIRLLAAFLKLDYQTEPVDFYPGKQHKNEEFLTINPLGQLPVLRDGDLVIRDAQAILLYLANKYDSERSWWPANNALRVGEVAMWLSFADQITSTASAARLHDMLGYELDVDAARSGANTLFRVLEDHLTDREFDGDDWIAGDCPTIADIACFPYTALCGDGGISLQPFPAIQRWVRRFTALPGFVAMPGINCIK